jgi:uroporphyrinogen decarboxylase
MTSRERVLTALAHQPTDRVPVDFGAMRSTGISAVGYGRLTRHLGLDVPILVYDVVQGLAQPDWAVLDRFGVDVIDLGRAWFTEPSDWRDWTLPDGTPAKVPAWFQPESDGQGGWRVRGDHDQIIGVMPRGQEFLTQTFRPLAPGAPLALRTCREESEGMSRVTSLNDLAHAMAQVTWGRCACAPWHPGLDDQRWEQMRTRAAELRASTDKAVLCAFGGNLMEWSQFLRGFGQFLLDLAERPRYAHWLLEALTELHLRNLDRFLDAVGDSVDIIQMGDDLGTQHGPQISPAMYREFFLPRHRAIYNRVKERSQAKVFLHCCGGVRELLPHLIEAGVEILNPVQTSAAGMDPQSLKREFGRDLVFWGGGCETQTLLIHGTPQQVQSQVRERIGIFGEGGGYVFNQVHNVLSDVPPENVVAMFDAARELT